MIYIYIVIAAASVPILNNFFEILGHGYSWWLTPLIMLGVFSALMLIHFLVAVAWIMTIDVNKPQKPRRAFRTLINLTLPSLLALARVDIRTDGSEEKVPNDGRMLFVCNHQHDFDPIIIMTVFHNHELGFIGKKEIYKEMPFVARAMHGLYGLPIDRENNREAAKTIIEATKLIKEDKASIGLFPEGYASKTGELLPIRNGSLKIAYRANVPIVVCAINNTREIPKRMFRRHTFVDFKVLEIIDPSEYENMTTVELGDRIHAELQTALEELKQKQDK